MTEEETAELRQKQAQEGLERMRAYWEKAAQEETDIEVKRWKTLGKMVMLFLCCAVLIYGSKLLYSAYVHVRDQSRLNETTAQISQLVDNIRQAYAIQGEKLLIDQHHLMQNGVVPPSMVAAKGYLQNPFGGKVVIRPSVPVKNSGKTAFKFSYQGLPHNICVDLAQMDWGTVEHGLLAVALGVADDAGNDKALVDIDGIPTKSKPRRIRDALGRWRLVQPRPQYLLNVARPNDNFQPTPFTEDDAIAGCACGGKNRCSFALRYAL